MSLARAPSRLLLPLAAALIAPAAAQATVMIPMSIEQMAQRAAAVVRGRVLSSEARWDAEHTRIYTFTEIEVLDPIHTSAALPRTITVRSLGGEVGTIGMKVSGAEKFTLNEEVVVFLNQDRLVQSTFQVIGMSQGKYHIEREAKGRAVAVADAEGIAFARPDASGTLKVDARHERPGRIPLTELKARVSAAIAARGTPAQQAPAVTPPAVDTPPAPVNEQR